MAKSSTQHDRQRLRDIVEASNAIADFVADSADAGLEEDLATTTVNLLPSAA